MKAGDGDGNDRRSTCRVVVPIRRPVNASMFTSFTTAAATVHSMYAAALMGLR